MFSRLSGCFHYGPAPAVIFLIALVSGLALLSWGTTDKPKPDLVMMVFAREHVSSYEKTAEKFLARTGKRVEIQLVDIRALHQRLQEALLSGADVPDLVEIVEPSMGLFTKGPLSEVGFIDLTDRLHAEGWFEKLVSSRFSLWSSRGRVFAIPHDVHPVMLCYRRDLIEAEGIDVTKLTTWDEFARVGREVVAKHRRPDGSSDRYMLDLGFGGGGLLPLLLQRGASIIDAQGEVAFDSPEVAEVLLWYVRAVEGNTRIAFDAGGGQNLSQTMNDGLVLFYLCPDWRSRSFRMDVPGLSGKLALMPLPAWSPGGRRTTILGGTGLAIPKRSRNPDLAWEFAKMAYYDPSDAAARFADNYILPPIKEAWSLPELNAPDPFYSGQQRGRLYAELAPDTPPRFVTAFTGLADGKVAEAFVNTLGHYRKHGENGLEEFAKSELARTARQVKEQMNRNEFYKLEKATKAGGK